MSRFSLLAILIGLVACGGCNRDSSITDGNADGDAPSLLTEANENDKGGEAVTLAANDDVKIFGTFRAAKEKNDRVILLFHQARSNRHEYDPIAPQLNELGFDTLAIDQRSGGEMWDSENETVKANGKSTEYLYALPDLQAAVDWAVEKEYKTIITVGSSYSAALNFILAKENADTLTAIASFSPGEYLGKPDLVKEAAADVKLPVYVTASHEKREQAAAEEVLSKLKSDKVTRYEPEEGVHGSSTLREVENPIGAKANFDEFKKFLDSFVK